MTNGVPAGLSSNLDALFNPARAYATAVQIAKASKAYRDSFNSLNTSVAYSAFFELLWYSQVRQLCNNSDNLLPLQHH